MSDENNAALEQKATFVIEGDDQTSEQIAAEAQTTESAPVEDAKEPDSTEAEKPTEDGFQKRINKVTKEKYTEIRGREAETKRANDLQKRLDEIEANKPTLEKPTLEGHEYDDEAFNKAEVAYQVQEQVKAALVTQGAKQDKIDQDTKAQQTLDTFNERVAASGIEDFAKNVDAIPTLPAGIADAIMELDNGVSMVEYLYTHLDKADELASMTPMAAMLEVGRISANMSVKPDVKPSAAPDPIETLSSGDVIPTERGPDGATYE
jgi:hypothetical protein